MKNILVIRANAPGYQIKYFGSPKAVKQGSGLPDPTLATPLAASLPNFTQGRNYFSHIIISVDTTMAAPIDFKTVFNFTQRCSVHLI